MPKVSALPAKNTEATPDAQSAKIEHAIRTLFAALGDSDQQRLARDLSSVATPVPRAGEVLGAIVQLLPRRSEWTVNDVKETVASRGVSATNKEIYNALSYLRRRGHVNRVGYGRYLVQGVEVVTSDDLGGDQTPYESD